MDALPQREYRWPGVLCNGGRLFFVCRTALWPLLSPRQQFGKLVADADSREMQLPLEGLCPHQIPVRLEKDNARADAEREARLAAEVRIREMKERICQQCDQNQAQLL